MNKKIFKSLFMGALLVGSVGTLTSCSKDYDDDINSLKASIAKLATTEALNAKVTELQAAISTAQSTATAAQSTATTALNNATTALGNAATNATALTNLKNSVNDLTTLVGTKADKTAVDAAIANLNTMIASKVDQSKYDTQISALQKLIEANTKSIDANTTKISANAASIATNAASIATNATSIKANADLIAANAQALAESKLEGQKKIDDIVASIKATYATKDALNEAVANLTKQLGALPTKDYVAAEIATAVQNLANKTDVAADIAAKIAAAVKGLASEDYVKEAIKNLASQSDVAAAKEAVLKAMDENTADLKIYIAAAIADQAELDAAQYATIANLDKSNSDLNKAIADAVANQKVQNDAFLKNVEDINTLIKNNKDASDLALAAVKLSLEENINNVKSTLEAQMDSNLKTAKTFTTTSIEAANTMLKKLIADGDAANSAEVASAKKELTAVIEAAKSLLQGEIDAAVARIGNLETAVDGLSTRVQNLESNIENKVEISDFNTAIEGLKSSLASLQSQVDILLSEVDKMVTDVDLYIGNANNIPDNVLNFLTVSEKTNTFGPDGQAYATFKDGQSKTTGDGLLIRVSPTTAQLTTSMISLLNTKGESLDEFVDVVSVTPADQIVMTRSAATSNSGLWYVQFKLKDNYDAEAFKNKIAINNNKVVFCVAVNSNLTGASADRRAVSGYDVTVEPKAAAAKNRLDFTANDISVADIRNRFYTSENNTPETNAAITANTEYMWLNAAAVAPITVDPGRNVMGKNVQDVIDTDGRDGKSLLSVNSGKDITIKITGGDIKGFYVALDTKNAVESEGSEIAAWKSYTYKNVYVKGKTTESVYQEGNTGTISITTDVNDVVGFRVYAVNYDGTLVDPDGRAFYVYVANPTKTLANLATVITPKAAGTAISEAVPYADTNLSALAKVTGMTVVGIHNPSFNIKALDESNVVIFDSKNATPADFQILAENWNKIVSFESYIDDPTQFTDDASITQDYLFTDKYGATICSLSVSMMKKMPSAPATGFGLKTQQDVNGIFYCYLAPNAVAANATAGTMELSNAFNGLRNDANVYNQNYHFVFSAAGANSADIQVNYTDPTGYNLSVPAASILNDAKTYTTTVTYKYVGISSANAGVYYAPVETLKTSFRSHLADVSPLLKWAWGGTAPSLTYQVDKNVAGTSVKAAHKYNGAEYSLTVAQLITDGKLSDVVAHLYSDINNEITKDEYFSVTYDVADGFKFVANPSTTTNPKATVNSTLVVTAKDAYGKAVKFSLPMDVIPE